jgi:antitoxin CcdA
MKALYNTEARKRPVNLTLNEDLVVQARGMTDNLSGVVENLLAGFVERQQKEAREKAKVVESTVAVWNSFNAKFASFADEHSTL